MAFVINIIPYGLSSVKKPHASRAFYKKNALKFLLQKILN
ncbi:hypothetical protein HMPREF1992_02284 [Selenomonas sp. oral taxon 892 str. F0426]|nr:hypothetical protein HMPREF1992_02284 [Selenomonas sp. oral taxon 892 str. F0426]